MKPKALLRWAPALVASGLAFVDASVIEPNHLKVGRVDVPVWRYVERLVGLKLAHISDLHVGGTGWRPSTVASAIDVCNREEIDLIAITGDFITKASSVQKALDYLGSLRRDVPRLAVLGNHDHVYGRSPMEKLCRGLLDLGITVLRNESIKVDLKLGPVWIVGVDDGYSMRDDLDRAQADLGPEQFPRILMTHYPDVADRLRQDEFQLSLAGHSHGGQIRIPILDRIVVNGHARTAYTRGLFLVNGNPLHVSPGIGMSGLPLRFRNRPEVTVLSFTPGHYSLSRV